MLFNHVFLSAYVCSTCYAAIEGPIKLYCRFAMSCLMCVCVWSWYFSLLRKHTQFLCNLDLTVTMKLHCWLFLLKLSMKLDAVLQNFSLQFKNQRGTFFRPRLQRSANNRTVMPTYETTCSMRCKLHSGQNPSFQSPSHEPQHHGKQNYSSHLQIYLSLSCY